MKFFKLFGRSQKQAKSKVEIVYDLEDYSAEAGATDRKGETRMVDPAIEAAQQRAASKALFSNVVHNLYGTQEDLPRYMRSTHSRSASSVSAGSCKSAIRVAYTPRPAWRI